MHTWAQRHPRLVSVNVAEWRKSMPHPLREREPSNIVSSWFKIDIFRHFHQDFVVFAQVLKRPTDNMSISCYTFIRSNVELDWSHSDPIHCWFLFISSRNVCDAMLTNTTYEESHSHVACYFHIIYQQSHDSGRIKDIPREIRIRYGSDIRLSQ